MCRNVPRFGWLAALVASASVSVPHRTDACSTQALDPTFDGVPTAGATDVPTNVAPVFFYIPIYEETEPGVPGTFFIETLTGTRITSTVRKASGESFEIVPAKPLQPNTGYRIRGTWKRRLTESQFQTFETQLEFTTGAGPRTGPVNVPSVHLFNLDWQTSGIDSCDPEHARTCVALQPDQMVEVKYIDSFGQIQDGQWMQLMRKSFFTTALTPALEQGTNFMCVLVRARAIDGSFSDPVMTCGSEGPVFHIATEEHIDCASGGLVWPAGARVQMDAPGTTPIHPGTSGIGAIAGNGSFPNAGTGPWFAAGTGAYGAGTGASTSAGTGVPSVASAGTGVIATAGIGAAGLAAVSSAGVGAAGAAAVSSAGTSAVGTAGAQGQGAAGLAAVGGDVQGAGVQTSAETSAPRVKSCSVMPGQSSAKEFAIPFAMWLGVSLLRVRRRRLGSDSVS
jgi:hypothetical protein